MADISWDADDPIVKSADFEQDEKGLWDVIVTLREHWRDSLGTKVVKVRLVRGGRVFDKDLDSATWMPATTRRQASAQPSETTMTFHTGSDDYPEKGKVEIEVSEA